MTNLCEFSEFLSGCGKEDLVKALKEAQSLWGYIPPDAERMIGEKLEIPIAYVASVKSFYSYLYSDLPASCIIRVCRAVSCHVSESKKTLSEFEKALNLKAGETTADGKFRLEVCGCLGACDKAPAIMVNDKLFGPVRPEDVVKILENLQRR